MLKICALYSGSSGNSIFVSSRQESSAFYNQGTGGAFFHGTNLLVDIGVNGKEIQTAMQAIEESVTDVHGILLTHEHADHMRGIGVVMRRYGIPLYVNPVTWKKMQQLAIGKIPEHLVHFINSGSAFEIGDLLVQSFRTPHDAVESVGYKISYKNSNVSVFTDIGEIRDEILDSVSGSDAIFIESNYDYDMLWNGDYPWYLKKRIHGANGHLSNNDCAKTIGTLLERGTSRFILSHLSKENNSPEIALETTSLFLKEKGANIGKDVVIQVAKRSGPSTPWILS